MKLLQRSFSKLLILAALIVPNTVFAATIFGTRIEQVGNYEIVITWQTDVPATSQVAYGDGASSYLTPHYTLTTQAHEVIITDLAPGLAYQFRPLSVTENGESLTGEATTFTLRNNVPAQTGVTNTDNDASRTAITEQLLTQFRDAYRYSKSQEGVIIWIVVSYILAGLVLFLEDISLPLLLEWLVLLITGKLQRKRSKSQGFHIFNAYTNKAVPNAIVTVSTQQTAHTPASNIASDIQGFVPFSWPADAPVELKITKKGFHTITKTVHHELYDIGLEPLFPYYRDAPHTFSFLFPLLRTPLIWQRIILSVGTVLLAYSVTSQQQTNALILITAVLYLILWAIVIAKHKQRYYTAQIIHSITHLPVAHAQVHYKNQDVSGRTISDAKGIIQLPYPFPAHISVRKRGYVTIENMEIMPTTVERPLTIQVTPKEL